MKSEGENRPVVPGSDVVWVEPGSEVGVRELTIRNVAAMFHVSVVTLLWYEFRGLIRRCRCSGGRRVYGWADCDRIAFIVRGRNAGLSLDEIAALFRAEDAGATLDAIEHGRNTGLAAIERLEKRHQDVEDTLAELRRIFTQLSAKLVERNSRR